MKFADLLRLAAVCAFAVACNNSMPEAERFKDLHHKSSGTRSPTKGEAGNDAAAYRFGDFDNLPKDFSVLFKPDSGSPQHYVAYMKDVDRAYFELNQGNFSKATERFAAIGKETLFETPNDATWAGHAESLCRAGGKAQGRKQLVEAQCSQQLLSNKLNCRNLDRRVSEPDFPAACYREYCEAEILRPDFDGPSAALVRQEDMTRLDAYSRLLDSIAALCR
jgi:hypothetical protein